MSGLNPDGLGRTAAFSNSESDSLSTGQATVDGNRVERVGPQQVARAGLRDGLVGHWTLTDLNGGLQDTTENGNDIAITGSPSVSTNNGAFGDAIYFEPGSNYGRIDHDGALSVEDGGFSVSAYVRYIDGGDQSPIAVKKPVEEFAKTRSFSLQINQAGVGAADKLVHGYGDGSNPTFDTTADGIRWPLGPLRHVEYVYSDERVTTYIDGRPLLTTSGSGTPDVNNGPVWIGAAFDASGSAVDRGGIIVSDLRIYDKKPSIDEIITRARLPYPDSPTLYAEQKAPNQFGGDHAEPIYRYDESKTEPHRLLLRNLSVSPSQWDLYATDSVEPPISWTSVATDVYDSVGEVADYDYVADTDTYYIWETSGGDTGYATASGDWSTVTKQQDSIIPDADCGSYLEADGTSHLFAEDKDFDTGKSSLVTSHWVADSIGGTYEEVQPAIDGRSFGDDLVKFGDPIVRRYDGYYYMAIDNNAFHPKYGTMLLRSGDLYDWEIIAEDMKDGRAGDLTWNDYPDGKLGFCELHRGENGGGVDVWDVFGPAKQ